MAAGRPAGRCDPVRVAAEVGQARSEKIDSGMDLFDNAIQCGIGRERVADQGDIDAVGHWTAGEERKVLLGPHLPIAAMYEQKSRRIRARLEEIDTIAFARTISEV